MTVEPTRLHTATATTAATAAATAVVIPAAFAHQPTEQQADSEQRDSASAAEDNDAARMTSSLILSTPLVRVSSPPSLHLLLDLDGTLLLEDESGSISWTPRLRPFLREFLTAAFATCASVSLWTAADGMWLSAVERHLRSQGLLTEGQQFLLRWHGNRCRSLPDMRALLEEGGDFYLCRVTLKPLRKCWRRGAGRAKGMNRYNTVIVDDSPSTFALNYGNAVRVTSYRRSSDAQEDELMQLARFLPLMAQAASEGDVRTMEKRGWRRRVEAEQQQLYEDDATIANLSTGTGSASVD